MNEPKVIKDFPGRAVEAFRVSHGGALPGELQPCPFCGQDEAEYIVVDRHHAVRCQHCHSKSPSTATQGGARTVWNARAPRSEATRRLNPAILPSLPGQKELTVTMANDDGDVQADAAIEAVKAGTSTFHITNPSPLFFHHLRLRVALEPRLADRIAVYYLMPDTREWRAVGLNKGDELRWPPGFELGLWEKESQISAVRAGDDAKGQAAEVANELRTKYGC